MDKKLEELKKELDESGKKEKKLIMKIGKRVNEILDGTVNIHEIAKELGVSESTARTVVIEYLRAASR